MSRRLSGPSDPGMRLRRQRAWRVARQAAKVLREQFGAQRVVIFGSLAQRGWFTQWSDIDLAAWGVPDERFYQAVATITALSPAFKVDLIDPETCRPRLRQAIEREGIEL
ncbi:MAG: nucleotidyltransferase domain-containing protein [Chloroflexi bacterium HGW-Chloroflexi-1]|nr:MAG: nucleotidyltransferase domain-containing protein [Chloroflexi bacterium HGW-Chloroflexi-1]